MISEHGAVWSVPLGTGFVVSDEGWVVTAKHVMDGLEKVAAMVLEGSHFVGVGFGLAWTPSVLSPRPPVIVGLRDLARSPRPRAAFGS